MSLIASAKWGFSEDMRFMELLWNRIIEIEGHLVTSYYFGGQRFDELRLG
jgi:hypothetical protein